MEGEIADVEGVQRDLVLREKKVKEDASAPSSTGGGHGARRQLKGERGESSAPAGR